MNRILLSLFLILASSDILFSQTEKYPLQIGDKDRPSPSWSPRNDLILTTTGDDNGLRLWDVSKGKVLWKRDIGFLQDKTEGYTITADAWSNDQEFIVTGTMNGKIQLWAADSGNLIWNIKAHSDTVRAISVSADGKLLVSISDASSELQSELKVWNLIDGRLLKDFGANHRAISRIRFLGVDSFQTGNRAGQISSWQLNKITPVQTKQLKPCGIDSKYSQIIYSPRFNFIATQCKRDQLVVMNVAIGKILKTVTMDEHYYRVPSFSKDEKVLFMPNTIDSKTLDLKTKELREYDDFDDGVLSNDASLIAATSYGANGTQIFELKTGKRKMWLVGHPGVVKSLAFSSDGNRFASGSSDRTVRIWDTDAMKIVFSLEGHTDEIETVEFVDDDKSLISKSEKETIVWDVRVGAKISEVKAENRFTKNRAVSRSGKLSLIDEYKKPFRLIETKSQKTLKEFVFIDQLDNFVFTPDENSFLAKPWWDGWQLWDIDSVKAVRTFVIGYSYYNSVAFHPDGRRFITGGEGQNIFMFDLKTGETIWSIFPIDTEEFEQKKAWEARRVGFLKWREDYAARADEDNRERAKNINAQFSHYGTAESFWDQKIAESGERKQSILKLPKERADAAWFTLINNSDMPVSIKTNGMMFNPKCKGLCDGVEVSSRYVIEMKDGTTNVNGFDMYANTLFPPKTTIYFSIALEHLRMSNAVCVGFIFQKGNPIDKNSDDFGTEQKLYIRASDLP